jgi:hypothetical protein
MSPEPEKGSSVAAEAASDSYSLYSSLSLTCVNCSTHQRGWGGGGDEEMTARPLTEIGEGDELILGVPHPGLSLAMNGGDL